MTIVGPGPHGEPAAAPERVTLLPQDIAAARARHLRVAVVMHTVQSDWAKHLIQGIVDVLGDCGAIVMETVDCDFSPDLQIAALDRLGANGLTPSSLSRSTTPSWQRRASAFPQRGSSWFWWTMRQPVSCPAKIMCH